MKKIITFIALSILLAGCGQQVVKTVVVDKDGKVIETKVEDENRLIDTGEKLVGQYSNGTILQDKVTGCKYISYIHGISPFINADGQVDGCKNITKGTVSK